jgi:hypothetical protein
MVSIDSPLQGILLILSKCLKNLVELVYDYIKFDHILNSNKLDKDINFDKDEVDINV